MPYTLEHAAHDGILPSHFDFLLRHAMHAVLTQRRLMAAASRLDLDFFFALTLVLALAAPFALAAPRPISAPYGVALCDCEVSKRSRSAIGDCAGSRVYGSV